MAMMAAPTAVPTQLCSHPSHAAWWGTSPELPVTDFYHRSSKCKKCYIRQQQESKTRRITPSTPASSGLEPPSSLSPPIPMNIDPVTSLLTSSAGIIKSPYPNSPAQPSSAPRLGPAPLAANRPLPNSGINFNMNPAIGNMRSFNGMPPFSSPGGAAFGTPQQFTPSLPLSSAIPQNMQQPYYVAAQQATTPFILSRPPREVNRKVLSATIIKRCKPILDSMRASENSWPFNQPVDPVALALEDYFDIIKKPMDLRTIDENVTNGKYSSETQMLEDVRLVWENAKLYNNAESEIVDFAVELSEIFETNYKRIVKECEMAAKTEAEKEVRSDICAFCGFGVVIPPHQRPQSATPPPSLPPHPITPSLPLQPQKVQTQTQQITFQPSPAPPPPLSSSLSSFPQVPSQLTQPTLPIPTSTPVPITTALPVQPVVSSVASPTLSEVIPATTELKSEDTTNASSPSLVPPNSPPLAPLSQPPNSPPQAPLPSLPTSPLLPPPSTPTSPLQALRPPPPVTPTTPLTPKPLPLPLSSSSSSSSSSLSLSSSSSLPFPTLLAKPAPPIATPLLHCDGACLRAFHPHCLNLAEYTTPWLCNECRTGKPVLHWDPAKSEYFYYYYDTADAPPPPAEDEDYVVESRSLGPLSRDAKRKIRDDEEDYRARGDMYFDDMWCMWRCRSREAVQQRDDRQKQLLKKASIGPER